MALRVHMTKMQTAKEIESAFNGNLQQPSSSSIVTDQQTTQSVAATDNDTNVYNANNFPLLPEHLQILKTNV